MGALSRPTFFDKYPRPFAVFGDYDTSKSRPSEPTRLQLALKLVKALGMAGDYSGADDTKEGTVELWFSEEFDAKRFADATLAKKGTGRKPGYQSQRSFSYDARCYSMIQKALASAVGGRWRE